MSIKVSEILERFRSTGVISALIGEDVEINGFAPEEDYSKNDLIFSDNPALVDRIKASPPAAVVTTAEMAKPLQDIPKLGVLVSDDVKLAHALVRQVFDDHDLHQTEWPRIHPSAVIHESVTIPDSAVIGPGVVIGKYVQLGERVVIQANTVIERDTVIGEDSVLYARVYVGRGCQIGKRVILKPGCVIGAEGFGWAQDTDKHYHRVPQTGIVVIEDDVLIGSNCTIDRATYRETRIRRGCKIDALCHVAHNVFLDEDCVLVAHTGISGSSRFGKRVIASGQTGVLDHKTIADDVILVHRAGVAEDITEPGMYAGGPTQPFRDYARNVAAFRKLYELRQRVRRLEQRLAQLMDRDVK